MLILTAFLSNRFAIIMSAMVGVTMCCWSKVTSSTVSIRVKVIQSNEHTNDLYCVCSCGIQGEVGVLSLSFEMSIGLILVQVV